ncbi:MAG: alpha/beta hydrolase family protein [Streptosporangiaceae bacterium]
MSSGRRGPLSVLAAMALALTIPGVAQAAAPADSGAKIVKQRWGKGYDDITIATRAIPGPQPKARVFVPKGWSRTAKRTWPTLYVYGGGDDGHADWDRLTDLEAYAARWQVLVVVPDSGPGGGYTDWYRGGPQWETFHTRELPQLIERNFRGSRVRGAMGISSGGSGAVGYAARHPGLFRYVASYSGIVHSTMAGVPAILLLSDSSRQGSANAFAKWGDPTADRANWRAHDPYVNAAKLKGTGVYLSAGTTGLPGTLDVGWADFVTSVGGDVAKAMEYRGLAFISERTVGATNTAMAARLRALGIRATVHLYGDGLHQWKYWIREFHTAWPLIMKGLAAQRS